ncbi:MAG: hypothetical protein RI101_12265 [Nitrospira sp.]|nr:hypothetical protein [Nitrospira sp.]
MEPWLSFYLPHFALLEEAEHFVQACENLHPLAPNHDAKIMMHQTQRLISIADDLPQIRPHKEPLQVLFLIMCSENIAKIHDGFSGEGKSRHYVQQFFNKFLPQSDKDTLSHGFTVNTDLLPPIGFSKAVDLLYDIRCEVVHEGNYTDFAFHDGRMSLVNTDPAVTAEISLVQIRDIVVRGCIRAVKDKLQSA